MFKDVDDCIERCGATGKFQYIVFCMICAGMACGAFILYCIAYFTKVPKLLCQPTEGADWVSCDTDVACNSQETYAFKADPN